jgi:hypothetical protein
MCDTRTAQAAKARDRKRDEANEAVLARALADFEATIAKQRALEKHQDKLELETAATLSAPLMVRTI